MNANVPDNAHIQKKEDNRRKRKALLAGGVVLGLGAAVTLAAWSDDVFADGVFNTGSFELQAATDGSTFENYDGPEGSPAESAQLAFQLEATQMSPSQTVYAPLTIGTSTDTSLDGTFTLSEVTSAGDYASVLTYQVFTEDSHGANCSPEAADGLSASPWAGGPSAGVDAVTGDNTPLTVVAGNAAPHQHLCIAVTLGEATAGAEEANQTAVEAAATGGNGEDTTVTWVFNGQSTDA